MMDQFRVWIESTHHFASDQAQLWISKRTGDEYRYLLETPLRWSEPYDPSVDHSSQPAFGLVIPNELGKVLRDALDARYGTPKPEIDRETHYRAMAEQAAYWKALYEAVKPLAAD